ncbi:reverse transcriptase domain-containing protein [Acrocarpospora sp. B8E8]|uniref:reverse transcriptase domain-containing protein n=1 Tax=Acrocarpospora sp. B8E8 TaxID=3153572 RepID=UPI00325D4418
MASGLRRSPSQGAVMGELTARAFTEQNLLDAWHAVRESAFEDGEAGPEVERFEAAAARKISALAEELADGSFTPSPVIHVEIAKPSGGARILGVPLLIDRIVERALLAELDAVIDPILLPWSFAYRRGLGVRDAIAALVEARDAGAAWVARADIEDCFASIPRWEVLRRLRAVITDSAAVDLVGRLMDRPVAGRRVSRMTEESASTRAARCPRCSATFTFTSSTRRCWPKASVSSAIPTTSPSPSAIVLRRRGP